MIFTIYSITIPALLSSVASTNHCTTILGLPLHQRHRCHQSFPSQCYNPQLPPPIAALLSSGCHLSTSTVIVMFTTVLHRRTTIPGGLHQSLHYYPLAASPPAPSSSSSSPLFSIIALLSLAVSTTIPSPSSSPIIHLQRKRGNENYELRLRRNGR